MRRTVSRQASWALAALAVAVLMALVGAVTASAASAPSVDSESATNITETDATLEAQINPNGLEMSYRFRLEFGCFSSHLACQWISEENLPSGEISPFTEGQSVSLDLNEAGVKLHPGWEYRYYVEATNSAGPTVKGPDRTFTTEPEPPPVPPSIDSESTTNITQTDATLEAQIVPGSLETTYQFRLFSAPCGGGGSCQVIVEFPLPAGSIPASSEVQSVSLDLNNAGVTLQPGKEYRYYVEATNSAGPTVQATEQTFTTESELPGPIPLGVQIPGGGAQPSLAIQSPPAASSSSHRKRHRRHKRGLHRNSLHRVSHTG